jgi:hypothetical protein
MDSSWLRRLLVPLGVALAFAAFRKYFPAKPAPVLDRYDRPDSKRLPTGVFSAITIAIAVTIALGGYFGLRGINYLFAKSDGAALAQTLPSPFIWCFLPGFAALAIPWPLTIALLRRSSYRDDAAYIESEASSKSGFNCYRVMVGMNLFLVLPIAIGTLLALPQRLTFTEQDMLWTRYASLKPELFTYSDVVRLTTVHGYKLRDGGFKAHRDLLLDFKDGRTLNANAVGDGDTEPSAEKIRIILSKTGLIPGEARTKDELQ